MKFAKKLVLSFLFLTACTSYKADPKIETIVAPKVVETQASFSGNAQNAGVLDYLGPDLGFLLDKNAVDRYNSLVNLYGKDLIPPVAINAGIKPTNENFLMDHEHMVLFMELTDKFKNRAK